MPRELKRLAVLTAVGLLETICTKYDDRRLRFGESYDDSDDDDDDDDDDDV